MLTGETVEDVEDTFNWFHKIFDGFLTQSFGGLGAPRHLRFSGHPKLQRTSEAVSGQSSALQQ